MKKHTPDISVVIPVYNEQENLRELYRRLTDVLENTMHVSYEILFVDDGSSDASWDMIEEYHKKNNNVKGLKFTRNYGHQIALSAGLDHANGQIIVVMDADLQARPEDIPKAYKRCREGFDIVWAVAHKRQDRMIARLGAKVFYTLMNKFASINIPPNVVFMTCSSKVVGVIRSFRERRRLLAGIYGDIGFKPGQIIVHKDRRYAGKIKYSFRKRLLLMLTSIIGYSKMPLRIATYLGFLLSAFSLFFALVVFIRKVFFFISVSGYASLIISITFLGGIQLIILGIVGEYIGVIIDEVKGRPLYIIEKNLGEVTHNQ